MALARLNIPGVMLYGGSIKPGWFKGAEVTIQQVFEAVGELAAGKITEEELHELEEAPRPGAGACGGQFTANTMAMAFEVLGISPAGTSMVPAEDGAQAGGRVRGRRAGDGRAAPRAAAERDDHQAGARERDRGGRDERRLDQRRAAPAGGRARNRACRSTIDEFEAISERTPLLCDLQAGRAVRRRPTCTRPAACRSCSQRLLEAGILNAGAPTVTGRTIGEHAAEARETRGPAGRAPAGGPDQADGRLRDPARQPRARGLRGQARGPRAAPAHRPGARVRRRGGRDGGRHGTADQAPAMWS